MQRILCLKLASNLPKKLSNTSSSSSLLHSHPYKTFFPLTKPKTQIQNQLLITSSLSQPLHQFSHSWHSFSGKIIHGFLSNSKQFLLDSTNTLLKVSSKSLEDSYRRGWRWWFRRPTTNEVVWGLIITNVNVFMIWHIADTEFMKNNFTMSLDNFKSGRVHTLITYAFSHADFSHIVGNMIGLYFFGMKIGRVFGPEFLLKLYLVGALGGSVFFLVHQVFMVPSSKSQQDMDTSKLGGEGASAAVRAIMLLKMFLFPKSIVYVCIDGIIIPVPIVLVGIFLTGNDIRKIKEGENLRSGVGAAHLGGVAVGIIAWARIRKGRF